MQATASSSVPSQEGVQPQADPLPTKRGEIGFRESTVLSGNAPERPTPDNDTSHLPPRHPADNDNPSPADAPGPSPSPVVPSQPPAASTSGPLNTLFHPKYSKKGVRNSTIIVLVAQSSFLLLTIALWVILVVLVIPPYSGTQVSFNMNIFIHLISVVAIIVELVFLERTVFRYRAERYAMLHPGQVLPSRRNAGRNQNTRLAIAPWNRPPLPTYAAVLVESGAGTGDVEDNRIAVPPPPAYGHTRGSTLVLAGFISDDLREQSRRARLDRGERLSEMSQKSLPVPVSRPVSYSSDSDWEAVNDMRRATILADTLAKLEDKESGTRR